MKIYPVNIFKQHLLISNKHQNSQGNSNSNMTSPLDAFTQAYPIPAFKGSEKSLEEQLMTLDELHCPCCGNKMPNNKTVNKMIYQAKVADNITDYVKIFTENREYFHKQYYSLIRDMRRIAERYPDKSIYDALCMCRSSAVKRILTKIHRAGNFINEVLETENLTDVDREHLTTVANYLNSVEVLPKYKDLCDVIKLNISRLKTERNGEIYEKINEFFDAYKSRATLSYTPEIADGLSEQAFVVKNMLRYSKRNIKPVITFDTINNPYNKILVCNECAPKYKSFKAIEKNPNGRENLEKYVNDVTAGILNDKLNGNRLYLYKLFALINNATDGRVYLKRHDVDGDAQTKIFDEVKTDYKFENYEGIPCACCGMPTITHKQKLKFFDEIKQCKDVKELSNWASDHYDNIVPKYRKIVRRSHYLLEKTPEITEDELMKTLQELSKADISRFFDEVKSRTKKVLEKVPMTFLEKCYVEDFLYFLNEKYSNMPIGEPFNYAEYSEMLEDTIGNIHSLARKYLYRIAKNGMKELYIADLLVNPQENLSETLGGPYKAMYQNLIKMSVITVDHIDALNSGGEDEYYNKIGYCKACNTAKNKISFPIWVDRHPEIKTNLPKHLKYIAGIIKRENMTDMYDYPSQVARQSMNLAKGKLIVGVDYDDKD